MNLIDIYINILNENFKTQRERFIQQGHDPEVVDKYLKDFDTLRNAKYNETLEVDIEDLPAGTDRFNVDSYKTFEQLKSVIDYVSSYRNFGHKNFTEIKVDGKPIFKNDDVEAYYADTPRACITYKGDKPYTWCVSRNDSRNLFYHYRLDSSEPAFYFVKLLKRIEKEFKYWETNSFTGEFNDKYHFFVLQVTKYNNYIITSAENKKDERVTWDQIIDRVPELTNLKDIFQPKPLTKEEREIIEKYRGGLSDEEFEKLPYKEKDLFLSIYLSGGDILSDRKFLLLPEDLKSKYIGYVKILPISQYTSIVYNKKLFKKYLHVLLRDIDEKHIEDDEELKSLINNKYQLGDFLIKLRKKYDLLTSSDIRFFDYDFSENKLVIYIYYHSSDIDRVVSFSRLEYLIIKNKILNSISNEEVLDDYTKFKFDLFGAKNKTKENFINDKTLEIINSTNSSGNFDIRLLQTILSYTNNPDLIIDKLIENKIFIYLYVQSNYTLQSELLKLILKETKKDKDSLIKMIIHQLMPRVILSTLLQSNLVQNKEYIIDYILEKKSIKLNYYGYDAIIWNTNNKQKIYFFILNDLIKPPSERKTINANTEEIYLILKTVFGDTVFFVEFLQNMDNYGVNDDFLFKLYELMLEILSKPNSWDSIENTFSLFNLFLLFLIKTKKIDVFNLIINHYLNKITDIGKLTLYTYIEKLIKLVHQNKEEIKNYKEIINKLLQINSNISDETKKMLELNEQINRIKSMIILK